MSDDDNIQRPNERRWTSANQKRIGLLLLVITLYFTTQVLTNSSIKQGSLATAIQQRRPGDVVRFGDSIYTAGDWDMSPVVVEEYQLLFFTVPKVGCTVWKHLFRRMMGFDDWKIQDGLGLPHNPKFNGLKYLHHYPISQANMMMVSPNWTRAMFVRDPKERFVSAYLEKGQDKSFMRRHCCPIRGRCENRAAHSPEKFLRLARKCSNSHWLPQSTRIIEDKYWPYLNFIGHMEHVSLDSRRLLERIGAWDRFGRDGWGLFGNESIFQPNSATGRSHARNAHDKIKQYITTADFEHQVEQFYRDDYYNPFLNLTMARLH